MLFCAQQYELGKAGRNKKHVYRKVTLWGSVSFEGVTGQNFRSSGLPIRDRLSFQ